MMLNAFGKFINMIRRKNPWKTCDYKPKQRFQNLTCNETLVQVTTFKTMAFSSQAVLRHGS